MHRIRRYKNTNDEWVWDKGIEIYDSEDEDNLEAAKGSLHAYMGVHGYGRNKNQEVDYVCCEITNIENARIMWDKWNNLPKSEPQDETPNEGE